MAARPVIRNDGGLPRRRDGTGNPPSWPTDFNAGQLPAVLQAGLARFMGQYGHRAVAEIDVGMPRWSDDPTHILGVLANYLRLEGSALAPDVQFSNAAEEAEASVDRLVAEARSRGRLRGAVVRAALRRARLFAGLRELPKYQLVVGLAEVRKQLGLVGAALAAAGVVADADDIFFLDLDRARAGPERIRDAPLTCAAWWRSGGRHYAVELERRHVPRVLLSDGTEPEALPSGGAGAASKVPGTLQRQPGVGRYCHSGRPRHPGPGGRASGTGRDPRGAVHGPRLDAAVPHGGRTGHGDGRTQFPRRRGGAGVRHPGGGGRPGRHAPAVHRATK